MDAEVTFRCTLDYDGLSDLLNREYEACPEMCKALIASAGTYVPTVQSREGGSAGAGYSVLDSDWIVASWNNGTEGDSRLVSFDELRDSDDEPYVAAILNGEAPPAPRMESFYQ